MEFVSSTILINPHISPQTPFLTPKLSIFTWKNKKNPSKLTIPNSRKLHLHTSISVYPFFNPLPSNRNFQISAHFSRPTNRQNHLRKKLTQRQELRHQVSPPKNPTLEFDNISEKTRNVDNESGIDGSREKSTNLDNNFGDFENDGVQQSETGLSKKKIGESIKLNKLESWVEQYKKDSDFWGVGTGPIFTIYQNSEGKVEKVIVNEDEIFRRGGVDPRLDCETEEFSEVKYKISFAKELAKEMDSGNNVIPPNSTVAKFLPSELESNFTPAIKGVTLKPSSFSRISGIGVFVLCGLFVAWSVKGLFGIGKEKEEYTRMEKEMLRRKMKARIEKEKMVKGNVEVLPEPIESKSFSFTRPQLDKEELVKNINQVKGLDNELGIMEFSENKEFRDKIEEIKIMARRAREIEKIESNSVDEEDDSTLEHFSSDNVTREIDLIGNDRLVKDSDEVVVLTSSTTLENGIEPLNSEANPVTLNGVESLTAEVSKVNLVEESLNLSEPNLNFDGPENQSRPCENSSRIKLRIIKSAKEAREYLSKKHKKPEVINRDGEVRNDKHADSSMPISSETNNEQNNSDPAESNNSDENTEENEKSIGLQMAETTEKNEDIGKNAKLAPSISKEKWIKTNYHEFEPIVEKIGVGFRDNYNAAREKANTDLDFITELKSGVGESELEWMKDEKLREIVFRVRDNELSGRDPFYLMDEGDKRAFFSGLEKKVEQENEKLQNLHEYFHSNIENLDYGADGISLYDPPEKILPRWKVPPAEKSPEFLNNFLQERESLVAESLKNSFSTKKTTKNIVQKSKKTSSQESSSIAPSVSDQTLRNLPSVSSKTIIKGSDGSVRAGKRSGREFWQHTKKWSEGFMESYHAETDPEVKSVMKDMGKDLDRWITEKEIKEAADLMEKIPEKGQKFVKEKLEKVKREMELFGPQAVVSKYREYAEDKEEDYLWWLDLPCVLCIELYTVENGEQRVGFYSLEMASDLELDPKQHHVIAFEDAGDCKNFCYIIQAHMEMLGNGNAFVVARPPKDAFREAKADGFSVTVIRKGQVKLNIDQTLEEVEELIEEIGSKIYHDKIMKERSVDINALMKGVFGTSKPTKRKRSRRKLKKRTKK